MTFLAALAQKVLEWLVGLAVSAINRWNLLRKKENEAEKANQEILDKTTKAETKEERDEAAEETIRRF